MSDIYYSQVVLLAVDGLPDFISDLLSRPGTGYLCLTAFTRNSAHEIQQLLLLVLQRLPGILSTKSNNCCYLSYSIYQEFCPRNPTTVATCALRILPSHIFGEQWQRSCQIWAHSEFMFHMTFVTNRDYFPGQL
jgi:hypothetical protein